MSASTSRALLLAALMIASPAAFIIPAEETTAQTSSDVPVPFTDSAIQQANLFLRRTDDGEGQRCNVDAPDVEDPTGMLPGSPDPATCRMMISPLSASAESKFEEYPILAPDAVEDGLPAEARAEFPLDTFGSSAVDGAEFPFTINAGSNAVTYEFWYDATNICDPAVGDPPVIAGTFHLQLRVGPETNPDSGTIVSSATSQVDEICETAVAPELGQEDAVRLATSVGVDEPITVNQGETIQLEIAFTSPAVASAEGTAIPSGVTWGLFFQGASTPSQLALRTSDVLEKAVWATDNQGQVQDTFNPDADADARFMVGRLAIRSPFGPAPVSPDSYRGEIAGPTGALVDLFPGGEIDESVDFETIDVSDPHGGALQVLKFERVNGNQPWNYPADATEGSYTIQATGSVLGQLQTFTTTVALGAFDFDYTLIDEDSSLHDVNRGASTTFLTRLVNNGSHTATYELTPSFAFATSTSPWRVDLAGVDQNDRITLAPDEDAIIQVTLTPPSDAVVGDAARILVTAENLANGATKTQALEGSITQQETRDVQLLILRDDPYQLGADQTTQIRVFAWNRGTATDSIDAELVAGSFDPSDTDRFDASLSQTTFNNIAPGAVASIPIEIETGALVQDGDTFSFDVRLESVSDTSLTDVGTVETIVEAVRTFNMFARDGDTFNAFSSFQYGKINRSDSASGFEDFVVAGEPLCESAEDTGSVYDRRCNTWTNWTFHRFTIENTGNVPSTYDLSTIGAGFGASSNSCTTVLSSRFQHAQIVDTFNANDPGDPDPISEISVDAGDTKRFFLRVHYDGNTPIWNDLSFTAMDSACTWESYHASVRATLEGTVSSRVIPTTTQVRTDHSEDFPDEAQSRFALQDRADFVVGQDEIFAENPRIVQAPPGQTTTVPFTLATQTGAHNSVELELEPQNIVDDLRDEGYQLELVSLDDAGTALDANTLRVPPSIQGGTEGRINIENPFVTTAGQDWTLGLQVTPPATGAQEGIRHTFTIDALSEWGGSDLFDSLGYTVQIGSNFAFDTIPGRQSLSAHPGEQAAFGLTIENTGATRDTYELTATSSDAAFDATLSASEINISSGSQKEVALEVDVPSTAQPGDSATIDVDIVATARDDIATDDITETVTYTVTVAQDGTLEMTVEEDNIDIAPGGENAFNFTITNEKNQQRTVRMVELIAPPGWETTLSEGPETQSLPASGSETFQYLIQAPDDIVEDSVFTFVVRAEDPTNTTDFAQAIGQARVLGQVDVELDPEEDALSLPRGGNASFPVLVRNPGTGETTYTLDVDTDSNDWSAQLLDQAGNPLGTNQVTVPEKAFERIQVDVQSPLDAEAGHVEPVTLSATAVGDSAVQDEVTLDAAIQDFGVQMTLESPSTQKAVPGDDTAYNVSITNTGNTEDTITLSLEGTAGGDPVWSGDTNLPGDQVTIAPGETRENITVTVQVPGPSDQPVATPDGVTTVIRATSSGQTPDGDNPTVTREVTTILSNYVRNDVDGDGIFEMAVDQNADASDGFEVFADRDQTLIQRGDVTGDGSRTSESVHSIDADDDGRIEHIVDIDQDGLGEAYFDPDRSRVSSIPYAVDVTGDGQPEHPLDVNFDGEFEGLWDPARNVLLPILERDFTGDDKNDLLVDTDDDGTYDKFVNPWSDPVVITDLEKDGDVYKIDTDGDGTTDKHYNVETQSVEDATVANLMGFLGKYWWFPLIFLAVIVVFGVIVKQRW